MKSIPITPEMQVRINAAAGTEVDPASITAFECVALTNRPVQKRGSIFEGAVNDPGMFAEMADYLVKSDGVQLMIMHETDELPTGRVFHAAPTDEGLRAQFYLPNKDNAKLINDVETGVIGDVSVGMLATHLFCSQCGWDYRGSDATIMNLIDRTCKNDHTIGKDGVHLRLKGIDAWSELSLCGKGASPGAKIVSRMKASLKNSGASLESLAASGITPEAIMLSTTPLANGDDMSKDLIDKVASQAADIVTLTAAKSTAEDAVTTLTARATTAETALATATSDLTAANAAKATAEQALTAANAEVTIYSAFLKEQGEKAMIQLGLKAADLPKAPADIIAKINEAAVSLAQLIAGSGKSKTATELAADAGKSAIDNSAFTTRSDYNPQS